MARAATGTLAAVRVQLFSYNYAPEPTGIAPLSRALACALRDRGHAVEVVAAHPHYPEPVWGVRRRPYRELRDGIRVWRLPIWAGRGSLKRRLRQELSYSAALSAVAPLLPRPDAIVATSPSFPALGPTLLRAKALGVPSLLWLQDILPDGAVESALLDDARAAVRAARAFELSAYRAASRVVVISETFVENLRAKGVPASKLVHVYNPASRDPLAAPRPGAPIDDRLALNMGNIGHSQNLAAVVRAFEGCERLAGLGARFAMAGDGVAGAEVRAAIATPRTQVTGVLAQPELDGWLARAAVGVVTQVPRENDFNVPSKLMNFMGAGIPVVASVAPDSGVARILAASGGGWVTDSSRLQELTTTLAGALTDPAERARRGARALAYARANFAAAGTAAAFERVIEEVRAEHARR